MESHWNQKPSVGPPGQPGNQIYLKKTIKQVYLQNKEPDIPYRNTKIVNSATGLHTISMLFARKIQNFQEFVKKNSQIEVCIFGLFFFCSED